MLRIELSATEVEVLSETLESTLSDLRNERMHTDKRELREEQKKRETVLRDLFKKLNAAE